MNGLAAFSFVLLGVGCGAFVIVPMALLLWWGR